MKKAERAELLKLVGRAFRDNNGLVRWVTGITDRGGIRSIWLDEARNVWHCGGTHKPNEWPGGVEVEAPKDETYMYASFGDPVAYSTADHMPAGLVRAMQANEARQ